MAFDALITLAAIIASAVASIAGFGVGSILTPLLAIGVGTKLAVAAVSRAGHADVPASRGDA